MGGSHPRGRLDVVSIVKVTGDMVVAFSFDAFARDELLARRLAGRVAGRCHFSMQVVHQECLVALQVFVRVGARNYPLFRGTICGIVVSIVSREDTVSVHRFWYWVR